MSGGFFDYQQYRLGDMADQLEEHINRCLGEEVDEWGYKPEYSPSTIEVFKKTVKDLRILQVYVHRIDWLISGDDGEDNFVKRLENDLEDLA